jgi:hypothetical protein
MLKLSAYSLAAIGLLTKTTDLSGQVSYVDFDPDLVTEGPYLFIDADFDGMLDFNVRIHHNELSSDAWSTAVIGLTNPYFEIATAGLVFSEVPVKLFEDGEVIDTYANWAAPVYNAEFAYHRLTAFMDWCTPGNYFADSDGEFFDKLNGLMAFRIAIGDDYQYGWMRLSIPFTPACPIPYDDAFIIEIHDIALQTTLNTPLAAGVVGCDTPENPEAIASASSIKINWDDVPTADKYQIQYRQTGAATWQVKNVIAPKTYKVIKGLPCNTEFEYKVAVLCDSTVSAFTPIQTIATLDCKIGDIPVSESLLVFPNPATDVITINIDEDIAADNISVTDLQGNIVLQRNLPTNSIAIDISGLANGTYIIIAQTSEGLQHAYFVKQ